MDMGWFVWRPWWNCYHTHRSPPALINEGPPRKPRTFRTSSKRRQLALVEWFLEGLRRGDVSVLLEVLDPDAVVRADGTAGVGKEGLEIRGAEVWTEQA